MFKPIKFLGIVALIIATVVMFSSCNKYEKKIVGKWKVTKARQDGEANSCLEDGGTITFRENGICIWEDGDDCGNHEYEMEYSINNDELIMEYSEKEEDYTLKETFVLSIEIKKSVMYASGKMKFQYVAYEYPEESHNGEFKYTLEMEKKK